MFKNSRPTCSEQSIITSLKQNRLFITKKPDKKEDEFQLMDNSYENELKTIIKVYQKPEFNKEIDLVCKYVVQSEEGIQVSFGTVRQMDKSGQIIECRILGVKSKDLSLSQFVQAYQKNHVASYTQKTEAIYRSRTLQFRKKWAQCKFGLVKSRKSSSSSFVEEIIPEQKIINKQKVINQNQKEQKRKLKLISGSQISNQQAEHQSSAIDKNVQLKSKSPKNQKVEENKQQFKVKKFKNKKKKESKNNESNQSNGNLNSIKEAAKHQQISNKKVVSTQKQRSKQKSAEKDTQKPESKERANQGLLRKIMKKPMSEGSQSFASSQREDQEQQKILAELQISHSSANLLKQNRSLDSKRSLNLETQNTRTAQVVNTINTAKQKKSRNKNKPPANNTTLDQFFFKKK